MCMHIFKGLLPLLEPIFCSHTVILVLMGLCLASLSATVISLGWSILSGDSHKIFIILWINLNADSILNSSLSPWLLLAPGSIKDTQQNGFHLLFCKLLCLLKTQDFLHGQKKDVAGWQVSSAASNLGYPLLFSWVISLSQNLHFLQELSTHHDTRSFLRLTF